jgi:GR25 family glycosyltransferase involved in LPS biosynthesis
MECFDQIYVINCKDSHVRRNQMIKQFEERNIKNYTIFDAVLHSTINKQQMIDNKLYAYPGNKFYCCTSKCTCGGEGHEIMITHIAAYLSHCNVYKDIIKNNYNTCLILEDDCLFTEESKLIEQCINYAPNDWNILYLGNSQYINNDNSFDICNEYFEKLKRGVPEVHMYAVRKPCLQILIDNMFPIRGNIDGYIDHFIIRKYMIDNVYICKKHMGINQSLYSSIGTEHKEY